MYECGVGTPQSMTHAKDEWANWDKCSYGVYDTSSTTYKGRRQRR